MTQTLKKGGTFTKEIKLSTATQSSKKGGTFTIQKNGQLIIEQNIFEIIIWSAFVQIPRNLKSSLENIYGLLFGCSIQGIQIYWKIYKDLVAQISRHSILSTNKL